MEKLEDWDEEYLKNIVAPYEESPQIEKKALAKFALNSKGQPDGPTKLEIAKQVSAFSNSGDGFLVFGIDDKTNQLDGGVPMMIGTQSTKDWAEAMIPKLVYPSVTGCTAKTLQIAGCHGPNLGLLVIAMLLSERRPHWVSETETAFVRAGAHSLPMRPQTLLDIASRGPSAQIDIEDFEVFGTPEIEGQTYTFSVRPRVRLLSGPFCEHWSFSLRVISGYVTICVQGNRPDGAYGEPRHLSIRGREALLVGQSMPVLRQALSLIWDNPKEEDEVEATVYAQSARPVSRRFRARDVDTSLRALCERQMAATAEKSAAS